MLAFVGGHLGSARENLRMLTLLEEKQKSLEQNLQAVKLEQQMLKVLCKDSTSVYRVDLMNDRAEIVKIEEHLTCGRPAPAWARAVFLCRGGRALLSQVRP